MKILIFISLLSMSLFAHKLNLFTDYEDGTLYINAYFANGNGCQHCDVKVKSLDGKILNQLKTNKDGEANLDIKNKKFIVIVDAMGGHIARKEISLNDDEPTIENKNNKNLIIKSDLQKENEKLKAKVKLLQQELQYLNFAKIIFALLVIVGIFYFLKRVKK
ncbi:hypothetical protein CPU12_05470 [Malaciobacter molluscorum LMG 25693]|uniref:Cobalt/nickel ECF transporter CbiMNQO, S component CbiN n=1 Tax=Malaciobacter molluscorum LMG 25693 TaxID=870501 RepID=A0A2G1DIX0_9BACT|nr:hypothetical protein [Malaciobacter molluscorum]AXX93187.1 cobalt/nickel ECF transporter CbiMNQO, S component CbiN [Malaciobacter molluscorum LMG 25693]PHO18442.1 hypothetical protein CPU12_05470 [Malaciobacter molluscorum LMG 25693]